MRKLPLSQRIERLAPSATADMFRRAAALSREGVSVIGLHVGEPDFPTPDHIREAAKRAIDAGASRYTPVGGIPELRQAIAEASERRRGVTHAPDEVVVTVGAKHALYNLAQALYDPGDEVLVPTPSWVSYLAQVELAGACPVTVPGHASERFLARPESIDVACTPRTKALILCSPSNPTGQMYGPDDLVAIAAIAARRGLWVIVDEIYAELVYGSDAAPSLLQVAPELRDQVVVVDGVSKTFAMTGWRIGWLLAPRAVARACEAFQSQVTTNANAVAQHAALAALTGPRAPIEAMRQAFASRRDQMLEALSGIDRLPVLEPEGAFYVLVDVRAYLEGAGGPKPTDRAASARPADDEALARFLLEQVQLAVMPGTPFGIPGYLRLSFATSPAAIEQGVARLKQGLARVCASG